MRLIMLLFALALLAGCGVATAQPGPRGSITIDTVDVRIAESYPVQIYVHVTGSLSDGCTSLGAITQQRSGSVIDVTIATNHTGAEVCTMIAQIVDQNIRLDGDFPSGQYTVRVNGVERTFSV